MATEAVGQLPAGKDSSKITKREGVQIYCINSCLGDRGAYVFVTAVSTYRSVPIYYNTYCSSAIYDGEHDGQMVSANQSPPINAYKQLGSSPLPRPDTLGSPLCTRGTASERGVQLILSSGPYRSQEAALPEVSAMNIHGHMLLLT